VCSSDLFTVSQQTGPEGSLYCARAQRDSGSATTNVIFLAQSFRSVDSYRYRGKKVTVRFKARKGADFSGASSSMSMAVRTGTGTDQNILTGYTGDVADIANNPVLTTSWQTFSYTSTAVVGASITEIGVSFNFTPVGTAGAADYFELAEVELAEGETASTYFERLDFGVALNRCLPFYEKSFDLNIAPIQAVGQSNGAQIIFLSTGVTATFGHTVRLYPKRATPTITTYNPVSANADWRDTTNNADRAVSVANQGFNGFLVLGGSGVAASTNSIHWAANAEIA
jgi:hypothetical protein